MLGWIRPCRPWEQRNQTELLGSIIVFGGELYSLLCSSAQYTYSKPNSGLELDCPTEIYWFIEKPFITKAQEKLIMLFKPLWFCTCHLPPRSLDKLILSLQDQLKYHLFHEALIIPISLITITASWQRRLPLSLHSQHALFTWYWKSLVSSGRDVRVGKHCVCLLSQSHQNYN